MIKKQERKGKEKRKEQQEEKPKEQRKGGKKIIKVSFDVYNLGVVMQAKSGLLFFQLLIARTGLEPHLDKMDL